MAELNLRDIPRIAIDKPVLTAKAIASARFINGLNVNGITPPLYSYFQHLRKILTLSLGSFFFQTRKNTVRQGLSTHP